MKPFVTKPLARNRIDSAFPLVQLCRSGVTLEQWRSFASSRLSAEKEKQPSAFITVEDGSGTILGLASCTVLSDLVHERLLRAENLMLLGVLSCQASAIAKELVQAIGILASEHGCRAVELHIPTTSDVCRALRETERMAAREERPSIRLCTKEDAGIKVASRGELTHLTYFRQIHATAVR